MIRWKMKIKIENIRHRVWCYIDQRIHTYTQQTQTHTSMSHYSLVAKMATVRVRVNMLSFVWNDRRQLNMVETDVKLTKNSDWWTIIGSRLIFRSIGSENSCKRQPGTNRVRQTKRAKKREKGNSSTQSDRTK